MGERRFNERASLDAVCQRNGSAVPGSAHERPSIEETRHLLRSPKNAERLLEAVRGFDGGG